MGGQNLCVRDKFIGNGLGGKPRSLTMEASVTSPPLSHRIIHFGKLDPFQAADREQLALGFGRNYHGLLIQHLTHVLQLDLEIVQRKAALLHNHIVIASFVSKKIQAHFIPNWIQFVNKKLGFEGISFKVDMGRGFFSFQPLVQLLRDNC